jgi:hypothetical protein
MCNWYIISVGERVSKYLVEDREWIQKRIETFPERNFGHEFDYCTDKRGDWWDVIHEYMCYLEDAVASSVTKMYYECHITIEPVYDDNLSKVSDIARECGFKLADLLMKKRETDTEVRSSKDTFMTGHSKDLDDMKSRMLTAIQMLNDSGFIVWRYKIEDIVLDSRIDDCYGILTGGRMV